MNFHQTSIVWENIGHRINYLLSVFCDELELAGNNLHDRSFDRIIISIVAVSENQQENNIAARGLRGQLTTKFASGVTSADYGFCFTVRPVDLENQSDLEILQELTNYISTTLVNSSVDFSGKFRSKFLKVLGVALISSINRLTDS